MLGGTVVAVTTVMNNTSPARVSARPVSPRDELIARSLPLVRSIAARLCAARGLSTSFDDLYSFGFAGLAQAAERFDPGRGASFTTFAYYRIRGAMLDGLRRESPRPHVEIGQLAAFTHRGAIVSEAAANDNGSCGDSGGTALSPHSLGDLPSIYLTSLDGLHEIPDDSLPHPDDELERSRLAERVRAAMATLPEIERRVVELYYYQDLSFSEIGVRLGICKPWAFRLHGKAMRQLRDLLSALDESAVPAAG